MLQTERNALIGEAVGLPAEGVLHSPAAATYSLDDFGRPLRHAVERGKCEKVILLPSAPAEFTQPCV